MTNRVGYLGPTGSNAEQAAIKYDSKAKLLPFGSNRAVAGAVESGEADEGVVPIENSLQGSVTDTVDMLIHDYGLLIRSELVLPIKHRLMAKAGTALPDIEVVFSHPQALAQCRAFLREQLSDAELVASLSTSASVGDMQDSDHVAAAIATDRAAELYSASIIARDIQDNPNNTTRFVVLAATDHPPTGMDKTSICFDFKEDAPGLLFSVMEELARRRINLTKIESRPTRQSLGRYIFLVDLEGHREDAAIQDALESVRGQVSMFKVLGSYPMNVSSAVADRRLQR